MTISFDLLLWTAFVEDKHKVHIEALKKTGYEAVEIPIFEGDPSHYAALGRVLDDLGLKRTGITVIPSVEMNPIGEEPGQRAKARSYLNWALDCTAALGASALVGPIHSTLGHFSGAGPTQAERERCVEFHKEVGEAARQRNVKVAVESLNRFECYVLTTVADLAAHLDKVAHPNVVGMYDTFHANIEEKDPIGAIKDIARHLGHVHISENDRGTPGRGHVDLPGVFAALKAVGYSGHLTIEAFGRALPALAAATRVWRDLSPSPEEVYRVGYETISKGWRGP
ncbi:MAG: sugar phosphate isomerase/epimerase [Methylobacteriaceae bacterium]|nr:sugar phosphate isomerase/epimerase [Methylobacteriaceae bacterium]